MIRRPPRSTQSRSSAASDVYKRQEIGAGRDLIAEFHLLGNDRLGHRWVVAGWVAVAGEDRADHRGVALAAGIGAQFVNSFAPPFDLRRAIALVGEGAQDQPADTLWLRLRVSTGANAAGRGAVEMRLLLPGLLHHDRHRGLEVLDAAGDVGIVAG